MVVADLHASRDRGQELAEGWIMSEVERGTALLGLYPKNAENRERDLKETGRG